MAAVGFSYDTLPKSEVAQLRTAAESIRRRVRASVETLFQVGKELLEARKLFSGDQLFNAWLRYEFSMPRTTAWRLMNVAGRYYIRVQFGTPLFTALYELASPSLSEEIRQEVEERAKGAKSSTLTKSSGCRTRTQRCRIR
jgi:hypothetical protein